MVTGMTMHGHHHHECDETRKKEGKEKSMVTGMKGTRDRVCEEEQHVSRVYGGRERRGDVGLNDHGRDGCS